MKKLIKYAKNNARLSMLIAGWLFITYMIVDIIVDIIAKQNN